MFHQLIDTKPNMFRFNDAKTVAWFPTTVRLFCLFVYPYSLLHMQPLTLSEFCASPCTCIAPGNTGGRERLLPVWGSVWIGFAQPELYTVTFPSGSVQEAAQCQTDSGGHEGVPTFCWKVSVQCLIKQSSSVFAGVVSLWMCNENVSFSHSSQFASRSLEEVLNYEDDVLAALLLDFTVGVSPDQRVLLWLCLYSASSAVSPSWSINRLNGMGTQPSLTLEILEKKSPVKTGNRQSFPPTKTCWNSTGLYLFIRHF